jgi:hypothetical protein
MEIFCDEKMAVNLLSTSIAILTVLVFGTLAFSFHFNWPFFEYNILLLGQTDDSKVSSPSPFSLSTLVEQ